MELYNPITLQLRIGNPPDLLSTITTLNGFKVRLGIAAKEIYCNRSIRTNPSHQALHPKSNYIPHPNKIENSNVG